MFNKLENEYKLKLEEQQRLNDLKLEEIKKSLLENQEQLIIKQCNAVAVNTSNNNTSTNTLTMSNLNQSQDLLKSTFTIDKSKKHQQQVSPTSSSSSSSGVATEPLSRAKSGDKLDSPMEMSSLANGSQANSVNQTSSIVENAKYISNLRLELKSKHARHVQDIKDYYEKELELKDKELEDLRRKLNKMEQISNANGENDEHSDKIISIFQQKNIDQVNLNSELKNTNNSLLNKLVSADLKPESSLYLILNILLNDNIICSIVRFKG